MKQQPGIILRIRNGVDDECLDTSSFVKPSEAVDDLSASFCLIAVSVSRN